MGQKIAAMFHLSEFLGLKSLPLNFALIKFVGSQVREKNLKSQRLGLTVGRTRPCLPFADFTKTPLTELLLTF